MDSGDNEVVIDLSPVIRVYKDGRIERIFRSPHVPPSPEDSATGFSSKDVTISSDLKARIFLPKLSTVTANNQKLPILVYFHGGGFCVGSTFSFLSQRYLNLLCSESTAFIISVEYPLAPEHPLSAIYHDSWKALQWVASHVLEENPKIEKEPWLIDHGDFKKIFVGGDSAGGNIANDVALRAGIEGLNGKVKILGVILSFPYFLSSSQNRGDSLLIKIWGFVNPSAENGIDDPKINPFVEKASLGCSKMLVCVAEKDELRNLGVCHAEAMEKSGKSVEVVDVEGEGHCFQILNPESDKAKNLINRIANFIKL